MILSGCKSVCDTNHSCKKKALPKIQPSLNKGPNEDIAETIYKQGPAATGISSTPKTISFNGFVNLGRGYNSIAGQFRNDSVDTKHIKPVDLFQVNYDLTYISSYNELAESLKVDTSVSLGFSSYASASLSSSLFRAVKFSSNKAYALLDMRAITSMEGIEDFNLLLEPLKRFKQDTNDFVSTYGDGFVSSITKGATLYALLEFSTTSADEKTVSNMKANVSAGVGSFTGSAEHRVEHFLEKINKNTNIRVYYAQAGGKYDSKNGVIILSPDDLINRAKVFTTEFDTSRQNASILSFTVMDYNVASNRPSGVVLKPPLNEMITLEELAKLRGLLVQELNTVQDYSNRNNYSEVDQQKGLNREKYLEITLRDLDSAIQSYVNMPSSMVNANTELQSHESIVMCPIIGSHARKIFDCLLPKEFKPNPVEPLPPKMIPGFHTIYKDGNPPEGRWSCGRSEGTPPFSYLCKKTFKFEEKSFIRGAVRPHINTYVSPNLAPIPDLIARCQSRQGAITLSNVLAVNSPKDEPNVYTGFDVVVYSSVEMGEYCFTLNWLAIDVNNDQE